MESKLRKVRVENGAKIEEMAELLNVSADEYIDKEDGIISLTNGEKKLLSEYYDITENSFT